MLRSCLLGLVLITACKTKLDEPAPPATGSAPAPGDARPDGPNEPPRVKHAYFDEAGRQGKCEFVKFEGKGKTRTTRFQVTPPPGKRVVHFQSWLYYYDKAGKVLESYPQATPPEPGPQVLGDPVIPPGTDTVECELSRLTFEDDSFWFNANLVRHFNDDRPKGGRPESELATHTGQRVLVDLVDAKSGKVKLTNTTTKAVKSVEVHLIAMYADGTHAWIGIDTEIAIKPGETIAVTLDLHDKTVPTDAKTFEATAPDVKFADDTEFVNNNLSGFDLPNLH